MEIYVHLVQDKIKDKELEIRYVLTFEQIVNVDTEIRHEVLFLLEICNDDLELLHR